ncbi:MAG TPA: hypothetical protein VL361_19720 [Candidatus Limnocylindrales bacterium]|nr:hypothetical protein [Candidatus Limnocylindrales bacterium]
MTKHFQRTSLHSTQARCAFVQVTLLQAVNRRANSAAWLFLLFWSLPCSACRAQEAHRASLAGSDTAAARHEAAQRLVDPAFQLGPTTWMAGAAIGLLASDNIRLESVDPKSDLAAQPELHARMVWPLSVNNAINLNVRSGYSAYLQHTEFNRFYIGPESELAFELYAGDWRVALHDRLSVLQNNYQDPTVVGSGDYSQLDNRIGASAIWDLNEVLFGLRYDHVNYLSYSDSEAIARRLPNAQSEVFSSSLGYRSNPGFMVGLESGGTLFDYENPGSGGTFADAIEWTVGPFIDVQISDYLSSQASAGYLRYMPKSNYAGAQGDLEGVFAQVAVKHHLNQYVEYTLSGGRNIAFALYGGTFALSNVRFQTDWNVIRHWKLIASLMYEHGSDVSAGGETFDRFGPTIRAERRVAAQWFTSIEYQFYQRDSNLPGRDYRANLLSMQLAYEF